MNLSRRIMLPLTAMAVLAASMPGVAGAAAKKQPTTGKDASAEGVVAAGPGSAKGKGTDAFGEEFKFNAKSTKGADISNPTATGKFSIKNGKAFIKGKVRCLEVSSDGGANFTGPVRQSNVNGIPRGASGNFEVFDTGQLEGQPEGKGDLFNPIFDTTAQTCSAPAGASDPIESGNIVVQPAL